MTYELLLPLSGFAFVSSITPGPNNLMLMASGANYGFVRTVPHMLGISMGHALMVVLVGVGLIGLFDSYPVSHQVLKILSVAYMCYLAFKIATAAPPNDVKAKGVPFTFLQAALFQWVNPKAWAMALTAVSVYVAPQNLFGIVVVAAVFCAINLPSVSLWAVLGLQMRRVLSSQRRLRAFNIVMAGLLIASLYPVLFS